MSARRVIALALLLVAGALVAASLPRPETAEERVERVAAQLRCPVCQGLSVADSPSGTARDMRALISQRVAEGKTDEQIRAEFRAAYGDWIALEPPLLDPRGAVWLLPPAAVLIGLLVASGRVGRAPPAPQLPTAEQLRVVAEREGTMVE